MNRRIAIGTILGGLGAAAGWSAFARGRGWRGDPEERIEHFVKHLAVEVDATPEQQEKLTAIARQAAKDLAPMRAEARETRKRALEILSAPEVDRAALENLRASKLAHADAASRRITQALADAAEVLNPEQRKSLAGHFSRMRGRRGHHGWHHGS